MQAPGAMDMDVLDQLEAVWSCRRCRCNSCSRSGAGELHDHVCTDGPHCMETRDKMRARRQAEAITAYKAADEIRRLRKLAEKR